MILHKVGKVHIFKHILCLTDSETHIINIVRVGDFCEMQVKDLFFNHGLYIYISALEHVMKLILCSCVLLVFINRICKYYYA